MIDSYHRGPHHHIYNPFLFAADNFKKPVYIFVVGNHVCASHVSLTHVKEPQGKDIKCFLSGTGESLRALAVHPSANLLFYSDVATRKIYRAEINLKTNLNARDGLVITANRGNVLG